MTDTQPTADSAAQPTTPTPPTRSTSLAGADQALHTLFAIMLLIVALVTAVALAVLWRARAEPIWWVTVAPNDPVALHRAESVEKRLNNTITHEHPDPDAWTIDITADEANAWLNLRLPLWLANRDLPSPFDPGSLAVAFREDRIIAGARINSGNDRHIVGLTIEPRIDEEARLLAPITTIHFGALALPRQLAGERLYALIPAELSEHPEVSDTLRALLEAEPLLDASLLNIDAHRAIRIVSIELTHDRARIHCRTQPREQ